MSFVDENIMYYVDLIFFLGLKNESGFQTNFFIGALFAFLTFILFNLEFLFELRKIGTLCKQYPLVFLFINMYNISSVCVFKSQNL